MRIDDRAQNIPQRLRLSTIQVNIKPTTSYQKEQYCIYPDTGKTQSGNMDGIRDLNTECTKGQNATWLLELRPTARGSRSWWTHLLEWRELWNFKGSFSLILQSGGLLKWITAPMILCTCLRDSVWTQLLSSTLQKSAINTCIWVQKRIDIL